MKVIITGASGFIGKPLSKNLSAMGHDVLAISRKIMSDNSSITWLEADLAIPLSYEKDIKEFCPEVVIHLAWQYIPDFSYEKSKLNLDQSKKFISFIASIKSCTKLLIPGSCWEYFQPEGKCKISNQALPSNDFTLAKNSLRVWAELLCKDNSINIAWFRVFYAYGPGQRSDSLLPSILNSLKSGSLPDINTPHNANDFIYIEDVVSAFLAAVNNKFQSGVYNLGSGFSTSVLDVCSIAEKIVLNSSSLTKRLNQQTINKSKDLDFWADITETQRIFEWEPKINLTEGISQTLKRFNI